MVTESYRKREFSAPVIECMRIDTKQYENKVSIDENGISHATLVEKKPDAFLDVPFRDFSMQTMVATGEVTRLNFVGPRFASQLDAIDNINVDAQELSARLDHIEMMESSAASAAAKSEESSNPNS